MMRYVPVLNNCLDTLLCSDKNTYYDIIGVVFPLIYRSAAKMN